MDKKYTTIKYKQTQKLGKEFAEEVLKLQPTEGAVVLGFSGNLGSGKTTFLQGFAKGLGIEEKILSPTFVVMKHFKFSRHSGIPPSGTNFKFTDFYHIDCYRLKNEKDILELDFKNIIKNPRNIVAVEWPEKIKKALPKNIILVRFEFIDKNKREIKFDSSFWRVRL